MVILDLKDGSWFVFEGEYEYKDDTSKHEFWMLLSQTWDIAEESPQSGLFVYINALAYSVYWDQTFLGKCVHYVKSGLVNFVRLGQG